jgi:hypothetical protein
MIQKRRISVTNKYTMRKKLGDWLLDVSKYVATAVIITSVFGDIESRTILYIAAAVTVFVLLGLGLGLNHEPTKKEGV